MGFWQGVRRRFANEAQPTRQNSWNWSCLPVHHTGSLATIEYIIGPISCLVSLAVFDLLTVATYNRGRTTNTLAMANTPFSHSSASGLKICGIRQLLEISANTIPIIHSTRRLENFASLHVPSRVKTVSLVLTPPGIQPGLSPINPNGFARPSTPNGHLHPQWPHTPPDSPAIGQSTNKTVEKLETQLRDARKQLEKSENNLRKERECLAAANKLIQEQRKHIEEDRSSFVRLRTRMASDWSSLPINTRKQQINTTSFVISRHERYATSVTTRTSQVDARQRKNS